MCWSEMLQESAGSNSSGNNNQTHSNSLGLCTNSYTANRVDSGNAVHSARTSEYVGSRATVYPSAAAKATAPMATSSSHNFDALNESDASPAASEDDLTSELMRYDYYHD